MRAVLQRRGNAVQYLINKKCIKYKAGFFISFEFLWKIAFGSIQGAQRM